MIVFVTDIPSPYQVELLSSLNEERAGDIRVIFRRQRDVERKWSSHTLRFSHCFLDHKGMKEAIGWVRDSDLVVFGCYAHICVQKLIWARIVSRLPWAFWGERPGANRRTQFGRALRGVVQLPMRLAKIPIWELANGQ